MRFNGLTLTNAEVVQHEFAPVKLNQAVSRTDFLCLLTTRARSVSEAIDTVILGLWNRRPR